MWYSATAVSDAFSLKLVELGIPYLLNVLFDNPVNKEVQYVPQANGPGK
jgi:hypothetical protein